MRSVSYESENHPPALRDSNTTRTRADVGNNEGRLIMKTRLGLYRTRPAFKDLATSNLTVGKFGAFESPSKRFRCVPGTHRRLDTFQHLLRPRLSFRMKGIGFEFEESRTMKSRGTQKSRLRRRRRRRDPVSAIRRTPSRETHRSHTRLCVHHSTDPQSDVARATRLGRHLRSRF